MFPSPNLVHPQFGDITADVIEALMEEARPADPVILEREQAAIAAAAGNLAKEFAGGHMTAQIHEDVADYWIRRVGMERFLHEVVPWLNKKFPSTACRYRPKNLQLHVNRSAVATRRGRWACPVPCTG